MASRGRNYWERHAPNYDLSMRLLGRPLPRMLELVGEAVSGRRVLEVAAGTGIVTGAIARSAGAVVATDYAAAMVQRLERRVGAAGLHNVQCEQADIYALRYAPGEFDAVVAANVLHLVPDVTGAIDAIRHVLEPGGLLVAPTFCHGETMTSSLISHVLGLSGFPGQRRFTVRSLVEALEHNAVTVQRTETLAGPIPIGYVEGVITPV